VHRWWVFLHVAGVFGFLTAHGVSVYVTLKLPRERDPARVAQLLEISASSVGFMWNSIGVLLLGGIVAGFTGHFWGQAWIWVAIGVFVLVTAAMYAMGTTWATRLRTISAAMAEGTEAVSQQQFEEILRSKRPYTVAAIGFVGLLLILWLMMFKPSLGLGGEVVQDCPEAPPGGVAVCAVDDESFVTQRLSAPADRPFQLVFANLQVGVPHNVAIYAEDSPDTAIFETPTINGPKEATYEAPSLEPGSYTFLCKIHPVMTGTLEVA